VHMLPSQACPIIEGVNLTLEQCKLSSAAMRRGGRARFKAHAWNACKLERVSGVRIPPSPPTHHLHAMSARCPPMYAMFGRLAASFSENLLRNRSFAGLH
jgi:hypothetical protein